MEKSPARAGASVRIAARSLAERADGSLELADDGPGAHFRLTLPLLASG